MPRVLTQSSAAKTQGEFVAVLLARELRDPVRPLCKLVLVELVGTPAETPLTLACQPSRINADAD